MSDETAVESQLLQEWAADILKNPTMPDLSSLGDMDALPVVYPGTTLPDGSIDLDETPKTPEPSETQSMSIAGLELSMVVLEQLLDTFRTMSCHFPFVTLPAGLPATALARDRPCLLLGAVASASSEYPNLQKAFAQEFKETLTNRVHMAGEVHLDLLEGLLVYLAWHHFHVAPRSQDTYRLIQTAISMVVDLGLDRSPADVLDERAGLYLRDPSLPFHEPTHGEICSPESRRALLGCYYLSACFAFHMGKPNNIPASEYMIQCAKEISQQQELQEDEMIHPLVRLQRLGEEVWEVFRAEKSSATFLRLPVHAERLVSHLETWKSELPPNLESMIVFKHGYNIIKMRILEMGLVYRLRPKHIPVQDSFDDSTASSDHSKVLANLVKVIDVSKEYLDMFISIPTSEYNRLPLFEWFRVIFAVFLLYRLSIGVVAIPGWNPLLAQQTVDLEKYLGIMANRASTVKARAPPDIGHPQNLFLVFSKLVDSVRASYVATRDQQAPSDLESRASPHFKALRESFGGSTSQSKRIGCPAFQPAARTTLKANMWSKDTPLVRDRIAAELQSIENERLWSDLLEDGYPTWQ